MKFFIFNNSQESFTLTTDILNDVNRYSNRVFNENDNLYTNDVTNNPKPFGLGSVPDKKLYLEKDRTSYCDNYRNVPNLKRFKN